MDGGSYICVLSQSISSMASDNLLKATDHIQSKVDTTKQIVVESAQVNSCHEAVPRNRLIH